ncbi:MAG: nitrous oxide reductase accessory protein NosL [Proteobacteria bacterium]|nr:nitrous oxide reductase accessory protein NosL [Pseudomonadota bacterium]
MRAILVTLVALLASPACGKSPKDTAAISLEPAAFDDHACASCGMYLREQPAPRGQGIHRDGTRVFFCSLSDLVVYDEAPSPHGQLQAKFVEVMEPDDAPAVRHLPPRPWHRAEAAAYVVDVERTLVMGVPAMAYDDAANAAAAVRNHGGTSVTWQEFRKRALRIAP